MIIIQITTGLYENDQSDAGLIIYPNPASSRVTLFSHHGDIRRVRVFDNKGSLLSEEEGIKSPEYSIKQNERIFQSGLHMLKIDTEDGVYSLKLLINK